MSTDQRRRALFLAVLAAIIVALGFAPSLPNIGNPFDEPDASVSWDDVCGEVNPEQEVLYYEGLNGKLAEFNNGPADPTLKIASAGVLDSVAEMRLRRCFDPALVIQHLVSAGENGVDAFNQWANLDTERMARATARLVEMPDEWAEAVKSLSDLEDDLEARFNTVTETYDTFNMVPNAADGIPRSNRVNTSASNFETLEFVDSNGVVILSYKRNCGFQPVWPKDRPPVDSPPPTTTPTPTTAPTTVPETTPTTPTTVTEETTTTVHEETTTSTSTPSTTSTSQPTTTSSEPPPTTTPVTAPKCKDEHGNLIPGSDPDGDGFCGSPTSGPDQQDLQDNDTEDVAPTPQAPSQAPPAPPAEPPTPEDVDAVSNTAPPEWEAPPAPAPTPSTTTSGGSNQPVGPDHCPNTPGHQNQGDACTSNTGGTPPPAPPRDRGN